jgi:hypothetical protein
MGFEAPIVGTRAVYLKPLVPEDYPYIRQAESAPELSARWRYRGATPSPDEWLQGLWAGRLAQFVVVARRSSTPIGLVAAYRANFQQGHAALAAERFGSARRSPLLVVGVALFVDYVFKCFALRKLYMELPEFNYEQFASGTDRYFTVEGRLRDHSFYDGRYWDELILAIDRRTWMTVREGLLGSGAGAA